MKIRTQFVLNTLAFAGILLVIAASIAFTDRRVEEASRQEQLARTITQEANELSYLSTAYVLFGGSQQAERWQAGYDSLAADLQRLDPPTPQERALADSIRANQARLKAIFADLSPAPQPTPGTQRGPAGRVPLQASWSRMEVQNQAMVADASRLAQKLREDQDELKQWSRLMVLALVAVVGALLVSNYLLTYRRTLGAISDLQAGTAIVGSGRLDYAIPEKGKDEITGLSRAFNRMTAGLQELTASRAELEREIADRKRAESERERLLQELTQANAALVQAHARVTEQAQAEQAARALAELAVKVRDEFMSVAAHELKTPVTSLQGYAQLLMRNYRKDRSLDPDRVAAAMQVVEQQCKRLTGLTDQLLDLSRLQAGKLALTSRDTHLPSLLTEVASSIRHSHPDRDVQVRVQDDLTIPTDPLRLEQVFTNLIDNAIKFSPNGRPVEVELARDAEGWASISVRDHGIGIPKDQRARVFERFFQAHAEQHYGGMGIGLFISRQIVEMHGGTISVEQPEGEGTVFTVRLPRVLPS